MLNNMNNFFATIKAKMIKNRLVNSDLIPIGTKDSRYDGGYSPTAITVEDFIASIPIPPPVDPTIYYSNVAWVDAVNGSDFTGTIGDFTKPFATAVQATNAANSFGFTSVKRGLVYVRRGTYTDTVNLCANIDTYCEPGVVYTRGGFVDGIATGSVGIYGSAKFTGNARALSVSYSSTIYMEFDEINQSTNLSIGAIEIWPTGAYTANVNIKCNKIYSDCRNAYGITIRGNANLNLEVTKEIKGSYQLIYVRQAADGTAWNGTAIINCPKIICENGGWAGNVAAYKNALYFLTVNSASKFIINGDIVNETIGYGGSIQSCIVSTSGSTHSVIVNGSLIGNDSVGLYAGGNVKFVLNGNASSYNYAGVCNGSANVIFNNSRLIKYSNSGGSPAIVLDASCIAYFNNCMLYNGEGFGSYVVRMTNTTATAYFYNCCGYSAGTVSAYFVGTGGAAAKIGTVNTQANKANDAACVEQFSASGYTQNALLVLPNF